MSFRNNAPLGASSLGFSRAVGVQGLLLGGEGTESGNRVGTHSADYAGLTAALDAVLLISYQPQTLEPTIEVGIIRNCTRLQPLCNSSYSQNSILCSKAAPPPPPPSRVTVIIVAL